MISTDQMIRTPLLAALRTSYGAEGSRISCELPIVGSATRVDVAVLGDTLIGIEIKSGCDSLRRLGKQVENYSRVFDEVWVVIDDIHRKSIEEKLPEWCGIQVAMPSESGMDFAIVRNPGRCPMVTLEDVISLLWREELLQELCDLQVAPIEKRVNKKHLRDLLLSELTSNCNLESARRRIGRRLAMRHSPGVDLRLSSSGEL